MKKITKPIIIILIIIAFFLFINYSVDEQSLYVAHGGSNPLQTCENTRAANLFRFDRATPCELATQSEVDCWEYYKPEYPALIFPAGAYVYIGCTTSACDEGLYYKPGNVYEIFYKCIFSNELTVPGTCTPDCSCVSTTCTGSTCSDGCDSTCQGTKDCNGTFDFCTSFPYICDNKEIVMLIGAVLLLLFIMKR